MYRKCPFYVKLILGVGLDYNFFLANPNETVLFRPGVGNLLPIPALKLFQNDCKYRTDVKRVSRFSLFKKKVYQLKEKMRFKKGMRHRKDMYGIHR